MPEFLTNLLARFFLKFLAFAVLATLCLPFLLYFFRPDLDVAYHLVGPVEISLDEKNFADEIRSNALAEISGSIDPNRSVFIRGFSRENLLVKLKGFPDSVGIHVSNTSDLKRAVSAEYENYRAKNPPKSRLLSRLGETVVLNEVLELDDPLLAQEFQFQGRVYSVSGSHLMRYSKSKELKGNADHLTWLVADQEIPSLGGLSNTHAPPFLIVLGIATIVGIPLLLIMLQSHRSKELEKKAFEVMEPRVLMRGDDEPRILPPLFSLPENAFVPANLHSFDQRLQSYLTTDEGKAILDKFATPMWVRYLALLLLLTFGLLALPTIVFTRAGLKMLWSFIRLEPLRDLSGKQLKARLRIIIACLVDAEPGVLNFEIRGHCLVLGTLNTEKRIRLSLQAELANYLRQIRTEGPSDIEEQEIYEILCEEKPAEPFRRRTIPSSISGELELTLFDCILEAAYFHTGDHAKFAAFVIDPEENGDMYPILWDNVEDLVEDQLD